MTLTPTPEELFSRARNELRMGVPVRVGDHLIAAVETLSPQRLADLRSVGGEVSMALTPWRARTLKVTGYDGDVVRIAVAPDADFRWMLATADPATDLANPLKGPFRALRGGAAEIHRMAIQLCKEAHLLPSALVVGPIAEPMSSGLVDVPLDAILPAGATSPLVAVSSARVPLEISDAGRVHVFRPRDGGEEHYAIEVGQPDRSKPVLSRLHSACFTGDLAGSLKCDCGPQLRAALDQIGQEGAGVLLYLNQEGRGIGLANKMRAYALQDQGFDTVEANHRLGFEDDERDFRLGAQILKLLGFNSVRLMTNNPAKTAMMDASGVNVAERVALKVGENPQNAAYLATKAAKSGHLL
ncbi:GTP cyclohydrolase II [Pontivivens insulae]|uniref:GTP cyclohydrolase-2 n=1 Tax=Pontivivens insulae TaxID=1639689 RepID=A0A2R8AER1_9RHOB|nr:GTP cyclohydrolase II [Pontivivens insulae]RED11920.1 GTP cyclohydrolase II [Pontivivens insulae]SPF30676.1 GTP cyclohydrolase-2 [Pontivivens insulae]